jgi:hypothetical protein
MRSDVKGGLPGTDAKEIGRQDARDVKRLKQMRLLPVQTPMGSEAQRARPMASLR